MHTWSQETDFGDVVHIHYNGDYSGDAIITLTDTGSGVERRVEIPCIFLFEWVGMAVNRHRVEELEAMSGRQTIGLGGVAYDG